MAAAQQVRELPTAQAQALVAGGVRIAGNTYAVKAKGITVTLKPVARSGYVKAIITQGCAC